MVTIYWQGHANAITSYDAILFKNSTFRRKLQYDSILFCTRCRNPIIGNNTKKQGKNHKLFPCFFFAPCRPGQPHRSHCVPMNINLCGHGTFSVGVLSFERNAPCTPFCQFILQVHFHFPDTGGSLSSISGTPFSSLQKDLKFPGSCFRPALKPDR